MRSGFPPSCRTTRNASRTNSWRWNRPATSPPPSLCSIPRLEHISHAQLYLPRRLGSIGIRGEDLAEAGRPEHMGGNVKVRMVEQVEEIAAELEPVSLRPERDAFRESEIEIGEPRTCENISSFRSKRAGRRCERALVEPALGRSHLIGRNASLGDSRLAHRIGIRGYWTGSVRIADQIGASGVAKCRSRRLRRTAQHDSERRTRLRSSDCRRLPVIQNSPAPVRTTRPQAPQRQVINEAAGEAMNSVEVRRPAVGREIAGVLRQSRANAPAEH